MNGADIKKAAINKAKQVAHAANGSAGKKRRKGQDLKPIITTEAQKSQDASPASTGSFHYKCVSSLLPSSPPAPTICPQPVQPALFFFLADQTPVCSSPTRPRPWPTTKCTRTS